jgi:ribonucleoside-diphosphate reductase beta chain
MNRRNLLVPRQAYKPFEYPELSPFVQGVRSTFWIHDEIDFSRDLHEFKTVLSDTERYIIGTILKTFAQTEVHVADEFWSEMYHYLPKPEVFRLCATFTENEMRHADAYDKLNEILGLTDYATFLEDEVASARLENLMKIRKDHKGSPSVRDICRTLAVFGGFTENVNLFSQFAILRSFSSNGRNVLTNIADIIDWSQQDEKTHAQAAILLFNILVEENPDIWDDEFKADIYTAARITFDIEKNLINQIFAQGELSNLSKDQLINFMKSRINQSLESMNLKAIFNVDEILLGEMSWFDDGFSALSNKDFFAKRPSEYTKSMVSFSKDNVRVKKEEILKMK